MLSYDDNGNPLSEQRNPKVRKTGKRVVVTMKYRWIHLVLLVCSSSVNVGCHAISKTMHHLGNLTDPTVVYAEPPCKACGAVDATGRPIASEIPTMTQNDGMPVIMPAQHFALDDSEYLRTQMDEIASETANLRNRLTSMEGELRQRGDALIQTRAEVARLQNELLGVQTQVTKNSSVWQQQLADLQASLEAREQQRSSRLRELTRMVSDILQSNLSKPVENTNQYTPMDGASMQPPPTISAPTNELHSQARPASLRIR